MTYTIFFLRSDFNKRLLQINERLKEKERVLESFFTIMLHERSEVDALNEVILNAGINSLNLQGGIIAKVEANEYKVLKAVSKDNMIESEKMNAIGNSCYALALYANGLVALNRMGESIFKNHSCYTNFKLESFIGFPLLIEKKRFGVLVFFSKEARTTPFDQTDLDFVQILGNLLCRELIHKQWQEKLSDTNEELDWLNHIKIGRELRMIELKRQITELKNELTEKNT